MEANWNEIINEIDELLYGQRGIITTAYSDRDLNTYNWNMDKIENLLKEIKQLESKQGGFSEEQNLILKKYKQTFLEVHNNKNRINQIYQQILNMYEEVNE